MTHSTLIHSFLLALTAFSLTVQAADQFHAGAAQVDITPVSFPVRVNGMVEERSADMAHDRLMSRALVLQNGSVRLAIVVVDSLMLPRHLLDDAKQQAAQLTGIPVDRILISATHTHSAPSAMPCLGSREDPDYVQFLPPRIVNSIVLAHQRLEPAEAGWIVTTDNRHNHCRRWIFRSDRMSMADPFGQQTVRAHMHPGYQSANHVGPSGPADTDLTLLGIRNTSGKPLAVLANYAMHYFGSPLVSGDFCGRFASQFAPLIDASEQQGFVGLMSQGTSGDSMWPDYSRPAAKTNLDEYTATVAAAAASAWKQIAWQQTVPLAMAESLLTLKRRTPDADRLQKSRELAAQITDRLPRGWTEVYAFEQIHLHEQPGVELKLQALRIGDLAVTAIPDEVFGITGLKLKQQSPLPLTMNIELANGAEGYIPPPEQHVLGGYTTWPARTAALEVEAEPQIVETLLKLLEQVADKPRQSLVDAPHNYSRTVLAAKPAAFWRLGEIIASPFQAGTRSGWLAADSISNHHAIFEPGVALYLPGPRGVGLQQTPRGNRATHFAGGRVVAEVPGLSDSWSFECWVWNGLPNTDRAVTGYFFSHGPEGDPNVPGDHLGIGGNYQSSGHDGRLIVFNGNQQNQLLAGNTVLPLRTWHHVVFVRSGSRVTVYLDGNTQPEIDGELPVTSTDTSTPFFLGGRSDGLYGLEGRLDEAALYNHALTAAEAHAHYTAAEASHDVQINETELQPDSPPVAAADALQTIRVPAGFAVELVASEPLIADPVAIDWGSDGKLWVAEMADYPSGMDNNGKPGGRIRCLHDSDDDGQYDSSSLFLQDIPFPTGVMAWGRGILVTAAPELFYAEDSDGDGRADIRRTLFSGFLEGNQQLRVNGLRWGLDGRIHCASGSHHPGYGSASTILSHLTQQKTAIGSRDFRFHPETGDIEAQSGPSQFGRNRDPWGHWFGEQNSYPLWHYVLDDADIRRNPHFAVADPRQLLTPSNPPVRPATAPEKRFHSFDQAGRYTSACSAIIYLDELLFPPDPHTSPAQLATQHTFTCEPFSNLVQHNLLIDNGTTFTLAPDPADADAPCDFFASTDRWCRPVMVRTGPDGALWVVDMYRYMIEHPHWLPKEGQDELRPFFRHGDDRGRIYRIVPRDARVMPPAFLRQRYSQPPSTAELTADLTHTNGWIRDSAHQQLLARRDAVDTRQLSEIALATETPPAARVQALCVLDGLKTLSAEVVLKALQDPHPAVRMHAVRLATTDEVPLQNLMMLAQDPHPKVRLAVAIAAGDWPAADSGTVLGSILGRTTESWIRAAAMTSLNQGNVAAAVRTALSEACHGSADTAEISNLARTLGQQAAALADRQDLLRLLEFFAGDRNAPLQIWQLAALSGMLHGQGEAIKVARQQSVGTIDDLVRRSALLAADPTSSEEHRTSAIRLLVVAGSLENHLPLFRSLLSARTPISLQTATIAALGEQSHVRTAELLLNVWSSSEPMVRAAIFDTLVSRSEWLPPLVSCVEAGTVATSELNAAARQRLLATRDAALRARLEKALAVNPDTDRQAVLKTAQAALQLTGDSARGEQLFRKTCSGCHRQNGFGAEVGPNLASLTNRSPESLLTAILDPGSAVEARYVNYTGVTTDGKILTGILATETASSLTFIAAQGKSETVLRSDVEELRSTGKSLMPEGLEKEASLQDLADIIEFVRQLKQ
ncbi:MAG: PVC-type heme-binding CxxCH protein [Planctomycetota bacterium]